MIFFDYAIKILWGDIETNSIDSWDLLPRDIFFS